MRQPNLAERQEAAAASKKELLERHREKMNDPGFTERKAAREAVVAAREIRCGAQGRRGSTDSAGRGREGSQRSSRTRSQEAALEAELAAEEERNAREAAARVAAAEARAARDRELEAALLDTRKARKAARKAKKRGR